MQYIDGYADFFFDFFSTQLHHLLPAMPIYTFQHVDRNISFIR